MGQLLLPYEVGLVSVALIASYGKEVGHEGARLLDNVAALFFVAVWTWFVFRIVRGRAANPAVFVLLEIGYSPWRSVVAGTVWSTLHAGLAAAVIAYYLLLLGSIVMSAGHGRGGS